MRLYARWSLVPTLRDVLQKTRGYVISLAQSFKCLHMLGNVVSLRRDPVPRHGRVVLLRSLLRLVRVLVFCILVLFYSPLLPLSIGASVGLGRFSLPLSTLCILEEVQLRWELPLWCARRSRRIGCLALLSLSFIVRDPLEVCGIPRRTLNKFTSDLNFDLSNFAPPRESRWNASI